MSTATVAPSYTATTMSSCVAHPGHSCIEIKLAHEPEGEELNFMFTTFRHNNEPTHIGVIEDLLLECRPFRSPSGFVLLDNKRVHFHFNLDTHADVLGEARSRLRARVERRMNESNSSYRRDPKSNYVHPR